jgi:hypothetical protein
MLPVNGVRSDVASRSGSSRSTRSAGGGQLGAYQVVKEDGTIIGINEIFWVVRR